MNWIINQKFTKIAIMIVLLSQIFATGKLTEVMTSSYMDTVTLVANGHDIIYLNNVKQSALAGESFLLHKLGYTTIEQLDHDLSAGMKKQEDILARRIPQTTNFYLIWIFLSNAIAMFYLIFLAGGKKS